MNDNLFIKYFEWQEMRCYRSAQKIVVVTDSFKKTLVGRGIDSEKIFVVKNGVDKSVFNPVAKDEELVKKLGLEGKTVVGYIGTHGMAHKLDFIIQCAKNMEGKNNYHFILMGNGAEKENLKKLHAELDCKNVTMLDSVPKAEVKRYISVLDISLINLKKSDLFTTVIPSKIFENAAMAIPILMGVEGEAQEIVESYGAGVCFEPENEKDLNEKLEMLANVDFYNVCKEGCLKLADDFDRKNLALKMYNIITK